MFCFGGVLPHNICNEIEYNSIQFYVIYSVKVKMGIELENDEIAQMNGAFVASNILMMFSKSMILVFQIVTFFSGWTIWRPFTVFEYKADNEQSIKALIEGCEWKNFQWGILDSLWLL